VETLAERIARDGPVSELDAIGWAIRLAKRLEALHTLGVSHGSVSPACVIAAGQDRNARAYLADVQHTTTSPAYHSPERILGGDISGADDVWALCATLYALLTGQSPFAGQNDAEIRQKILAASPPPLAVFDVGDDDLQHILDRAFARELGQRTASISAFRHALEDWHPDRGVANLPPLEDEDSTNDDDDGARTMLVREAGAYLAQAGIGAAPAAADPSVPKVNEDDDDDDNVRTMMRQLPKDDLASIIARASAAQAASGQPVAAPAPPPVQPAGPPRPAPFPRPGPPRPSGPGGQPPGYPQAPRPPLPPPHHPGPAGGLQASAPQPGPAPRPPVAPQAFGGAPVPQIDDDDSEDENIRTMMRTPEQMIHDEESHDAPRTMLLAEEAPWKQGPPSPAAGQHPEARGPAWRDGPAPQPTVALPAHFEPGLPSFGSGGAGSPGEPSRPDGFLAGGQGTQKIPPLDSLLGQSLGGSSPQGPAFAPAPQAPQGGQGGGYPQAPGQPGGGYPGQPGGFPQTPGQPGGGYPGQPGGLPQTPGQPGGFPQGPGQTGGYPPAPGADLRASGITPQPVLGAAPPPNALVPASPPQSGKKGLFMAALIALLIAAGVTFAFLKLKGL
jgi:hypothetical protein